MQRDATFVTERDERHAGDIGNGRAAESSQSWLLKMRLQQTEDVCCLLSREVDVEFDAEFVMEPRIRGTARDLILRDDEPGRASAMPAASVGSQFSPPYSARDRRHRLRIAKGDVTVLEDRTLPERVKVDDGALVMRTSDEIDRVEFDLQACSPKNKRTL